MCSTYFKIPILKCDMSALLNVFPRWDHLGMNELSRARSFLDMARSHGHRKRKNWRVHKSHPPSCATLCLSLLGVSSSARGRFPQGNHRKAWNKQLPWLKMLNTIPIFWHWAYCITRLESLPWLFTRLQGRWSYGLMVHTAMWCPPAMKLFINLINYGHIDHKSWLVIKHLS